MHDLKAEVCHVSRPSGILMLTTSSRSESKL